MRSQKSLSKAQNSEVSRIGAITKPATIVLEVVRLEKKYIKKFVLRNFADSTCDEICKTLEKEFPAYFSESTIAPEQLRRIVTKVRDANLAKSQSIASAPLRASGTMVFKPMQANQLSADNIADIDLNTCSDELNLKAKQLMDVRFEATRLKPGDAGFVYDKVVEFEAPTETADWDDEDDE